VSEIPRLQKAIRDLHGVEGTHLRSEPVHETFRGETVWEGVVEVFALKGHPKAALAYAWSHETDQGGRRYVAVLGVDPIRTPQDAVRAAVAAEIRKK
jgi:hypothetical protein